MAVSTRSERIRRYYDEVFRARNWNYVRDLIRPDAVLAHGLGPDAKIGPMSAALAGLTDVTVEIEHVVEDHNQVAVHFVLHATDTGGFAGHAPTHKRFSSWGVEFWQFEGDWVIANWVGLDYLGLFVQLGVLPSPWTPAVQV
jgi:predicted ester cyclase